MGNFQGGGGRSGGFKGGGGGRSGGFQKKSWGSDRGNDRPVVMHKATCSQCGKSCEVPFRPTGEKPVYCNDCFGEKRESGDRESRPSFNDRAPRREFNDRNDRPAPRPDFARPAPSSDDTKRQLADISTKLDRLLSAIERLAQPKKEVTFIKEAPAISAQKFEAKKETPTKVMKKKGPEPKPVSKKKVVTKKKK